MTHTRDTASNFETETIKGPVRFHDWIDYRGLTPGQRKRLMQHVIRDARAARPLGGTGLCALQAAAGGGTAVMRALAKAVIAAAGKWWRSYAIQRAHIAAIRELHALDDRTLSDIGVSRSEIEWVVVHGRDAPRVHWPHSREAATRRVPPKSRSAHERLVLAPGGNRSSCAPTR